MADGKQLKEILAESLDDKNFSVKKLVEATNIPERYIKLLLEGELRKLPPAPYVRGYLSKIASTLDLDLNDLYQTYKDEIDGTSSGPLDRLPMNRFATNSNFKKFIFFGILGLAILIYVGWNINKLIGSPTLIIISPADETTTAVDATVMIEGTTNYSNKLTINDEQIYLEKNGHFQKSYPLQDGLNNFEIISKKFLGRETKILRKVILEKPTPVAIPVMPIINKNSSTTKQLKP